MLIAEGALRRMVVDMLRRGGSDTEEAHIVADHLVEANLAGHDSHGVGMLPAYVEHLKAGLLHPNVAARCYRDDGALLLFDAGFGYGQRSAREVMAAGIARCRDTGVVLVGLRNAHHIGRVGAYGEQSIEAGLVSIHFVNVIDHAPLVAPFGGREARFSTNPVCIAIPGTRDSEPVLLDMATSRIAYGKVKVAHNKATEVPEGCLIDADGNPTRDPAIMFGEPRGALLPTGEHKGYGLALACELLAGALTGGGTIQPGNARKGSIVNNMIAFIVDPARFGEHDAMRAEIDAMVAYAKTSRPVDEDSPVLVAGEPERIARAKRLRDGIPLDETTWQEILHAAAKLGLS